MSTARQLESEEFWLTTRRRAMSAGRKRALVALVAAALLSSAAWSVAADKPESGKPGMGMHGSAAAPASRGMAGMMGGSGGMEGMGSMEGMMGMMNMMGSCNRMMQGGMSSSMMPQLPPGNEKLQMQMHAEMMQRMGETLAKYAAQLKDDIH